MRLLVTGGSGFIGSAVVRHALSKGIGIFKVHLPTYSQRLEHQHA